MPKIPESPFHYAQPAGMGYATRAKAMHLNMRLTQALEKVRQLKAEQAALMRALDNPKESPPTSPTLEKCKDFIGDMVSCEPSGKSESSDAPACASQSAPSSPLSPQPPGLRASAMRKILRDSNGAHDTAKKSPAAH
ncbi:MULTISPECIES: hypothetical protein [Pandoraea]|uniref:hypothetical protein n=1 Tax=Pandoraea TaxID=93217 RepID=UPI001F5C23F9|nr:MULTISPECIES: hypothetical protein [Pandoraea]